MCNILIKKTGYSAKDKFHPRCYGILRFITVFTKARNLTLPWSSRCEATSSLAVKLFSSQTVVWAQNSVSVSWFSIPVSRPVHNTALLMFWCRNYFFLILGHSVYKMWIIQEPNKLELWNKLHFEEKKKRRVYTMLKIFGTYICWINI